jgi:hypothetical protein
MRAITLGLGTLLAISAAAAAQSGPRELRSLTADDVDLPAIALAAARTLEPNHAGRIMFAGVIINGHEARGVSDTVVKVVDGERIDSRRGVPFMICRAGQSCPELEQARNDITYSFTSFRALTDTAFVGGTAKSIARGERPLCIAVARVGQAWLAVGPRDAKSAKRCGE